MSNSTDLNISYLFYSFQMLEVELFLGIVLGVFIVTVMRTLLPVCIQRAVGENSGLEG
jgi:hypothetical protein